jgi:hypothetical protein
VLDGAPVRLPNTRPVHRSGWCEVNSGYGRTDGKVTGVTDGTAVIIRVPVFVDYGSCLQAHKTGEQQRYQERSSQTAGCKHTNHARL